MSPYYSLIYLLMNAHLKEVPSFILAILMRNYLKRIDQICIEQAI